LVNELTNGREQEQFILSSKNLKSKALVPLIRQILSHPSVYVFGEFMNQDNVKSLKDSNDEECKKHYDLLEIFAYGTYDDYKNRVSTLPELTAKMDLKLKQLTIVQLASENRTIPYNILLEKLNMQSLRELEDLIIECMYQGLLEGKLDQEKLLFQVDQTIGRDIKPSDIDRIIAELTNWQKKSETQLEEITEKIQYSLQNHEEEKKRKKDFQSKIEALKSDIKVFLESSESEIDPRTFMNVEQFQMDPIQDKQRRKRNKAQKDRDQRHN